MKLWHKLITPPIAMLVASFLGGAGTVHADDGPAAFAYDIALEVPAGQRKLLADNLDLYRWRGNARMDETQLRRLLGQAPQQIGDLLATEGFYSPQIDARLEQNEGNWLARLAVVPGQPARVTGIELQVTGPFSAVAGPAGARLARLRADWSLHPGAVFRQDDWEAAKRNALKALLLDGYPTAAIKDSRATVNPASREVALQLTIDSGPAFSFGTLEIGGLQRYTASLVERLNPIKAGEPYSQAKLLELQSRLQDSPYFSGAAVDMDKDPAQPGNVPVRVAVTENPSKRLGLGAGVSTDTGLRGQVDYRDLDFLDRAWQLGGTLKLDQKSQSLGGSLQLPSSAEGTRDSFNALTERTDIAGELTRKLGLGAKRSFVRGQTETSIGLRYLTENQEIDGVPGKRSAALSPSWAMTRRNVDNLLHPRRGYLLNLQADAAARGILSDQSFVRTYARAVFFQPLGQRDQLILRGELGVVAAPGRTGIPSDFLFRTGGDQTVRGYAYQSLGIREGTATVGGRYLAVASAEYIHWLSAQWGGAVFIDAGNAADAWRELTPVYGIGAGARWKSPVGPLQLDLAYGEATRQWRMHFSVGFSF